MCHEIASPSRSGSVASTIFSAFRAAAKMSRKTPPAPRSAQTISNSFSGITDPAFVTKSRTCPYDASTKWSGPRYFCTETALAGDSTITKVDGVRCEWVERAATTVGLNAWCLDETRAVW